MPSASQLLIERALTFAGECLERAAQEINARAASDWTNAARNAAAMAHSLQGFERNGRRS